VGVSTRAAIRVTFARPARHDDPKGEARLALDPPAAGDLAWEGESLVFRPTDALTAGQAYTVTLDARRGRQVRRFTWTFTVGQPRPLYLALDSQERLQLYVSEGETQRQLTDAEFGVWDYAVHPEGERIAYSAPRERDGDATDLWIVDLLRDGENARLLTGDPEVSCAAPAWSADGRRIAYERQDRAEPVIGVLSGPLTPFIWLLDPGTGETEPLPAGPDGAPAPGRDPRWSPKGQRLAFYDLSAGAVQVIDTDSGEQQFFDTLSGVGTWDPGGQQMVLPELTFHGEDSHAFLVRVNTKTRAVQNLDAAGTADDHMPRWSPSGEWIAFGRTALADGTWTWGAQLWLMRPDGSEAHPLLSDPEAHFGAFAWRPDGGALAYVRLDIADIADPRPVLWVVSLDDPAHPMLVASDAILPGWLP
jgi:Tol biopolymer transport system component